MLKHWRAWPAALCVLAGFLIAGCGASSSTVALGPGGRIFTQARHANLHDAAFTTTFFADGQHRSGSGATTLNPQRIALTLNLTVNGQVEVMHIVSDGDMLYDRLNADPLWNILNDGDTGNYVNYDTDIVNYDALQAQTMQLIGAEKLDGVTTWHLRGPFTIPLFASDGNLVQVPGTEDLWLRQSDSLPVQIVKSAAKLYTADDGTQEHLVFTATYHFTAWNTGLTITPPGEGQIAASG